MTTRLAVAARTDVGRVRQQNEDGFLVADVAGNEAVAVDGPTARFEVGARGAVLAVSDGMGGHAAGEIASAMSLAALHRELRERTSQIDGDLRVQHAVERANQDVHAAGQAPSRMGATLTAVLVEDGRAHIAQVGDSRAYLLRNGQVRQVTHDQSYVQVLLDTHVIDEREAAQSPLRNVLLQAIGQRAKVKVALGTLELRAKDCLLLCSDGLWGKVTDAEMRDLVLASETLDEACEKLVRVANERGGDDNITVLLAGVGGDVPPQDPRESISDTFRVLATFEAPLPPR